jgi:hypothetical protein
MEKEPPTPQLPASPSSAPPKQAASAWLEEVRQLQAVILKRQGPLPDSAPEIAADRRR